MSLPSSRKIPSQSLRKQQGIVIVVALFIVALVATMAYVMMARLSRDIQQTSLIVRNTEAKLLAEGSITFAIDALKNDWENQKPNQVVDHIPIEPAPLSVNGYQVTTRITDLQSRYNLNNIIDKNSQADFIRLLRAVIPTISAEQAGVIASNITHWITPPSQESSLDKYYTTLPNPYRAAHRPFVSVSELRLVKGVSPDIFATLQPYVTALPQGTLINLQTALAPVILTLSPSMTIDAAQAIVAIRTNQVITSMDSFFALDAVKNQRLPPEKLTITSNYFLVETEIAIENLHVLIYTVLERAVNGSKATVTPIYQSKGSF